MSSFLYLYRKIIRNRIKKALRKPVTYIFIAFVAFYVVLIAGSFGSLIEEFRVGNPQSLAVILSALIFFLLPSNLISYSRRKGLLFRKSDIHFVFPAPVSPKLVIIFKGMLNLLINFALALFIGFMGTVYFQAGVVRMIVYVVLYLLFENVLEASMMILCYGNERLSEGFFKVLTVICYGLMAVFVLVAAYMLMQNGFSFDVISDYLGLPVIQLIPVVGWNIAMIRLIFVGPTMLNIVCTGLFCVSTLALFAAAYMADCKGEYYEDAAKFADDYAKLKANKAKGIVGNPFGKKKHFKTAEVVYKGSGAKAIFYRQLLEYKKSTFFIFGFNTLVSLIVGVGIAVVAVMTDMMAEAGFDRVFIIPGIMAYVIFIFSGYATKWSQELENPYTFLIPDRSIKKLWYATKMEHIRAVVDGILMTLPGAIVMKLSVLQTVLIILLYICLMANRLYYFMVADFLVGKILGNVGRTLVKLFFQGIAIGIGVLAAVLGGMFLGVEAGFVIMILVTLVLTLLGALVAALSFEKMEVME
ncbi:MAG: hypothetical protein HFI76_03215 [Lachnospiraceae bacterium]|nr:hypothetical protein [Lachnospiraceae bacterium]